ncbi:hypothetical protein SDC9_119654 [bioreactor metagenome]|uniref:Uncharacterized protein n=1 Tax=bioreactor metagenome TaxID=1076179 RepID=A0A645C5N3_9ZZZZ
MPGHSEVFNEAAVHAGLVNQRPGAFHDRLPPLLRPLFMPARVREKRAVFFKMAAQAITLCIVQGSLVAAGAQVER